MRLIRCRYRLLSLCRLQSGNWASSLELVGNFLGADTVGSILELARDSIPRDQPGLLLVDMFGAAQGLPLHEYLYDQLHFNARGQALYAEELFMTLGGVLVGPSPMEDFGRTPLGLERNYGFVDGRE